MTKMLMLAALKGNTAAGKVTQFFHYSHYSFETWLFLFCAAFYISSTPAKVQKKIYKI